MKITYRAKFMNDEEITRTSARSYAAAWALIMDNKVVASGFSKTHALAEKAGLAFLADRDEWARVVRLARRSRFPAQRKWALERVREAGGFEAAELKSAEFRLKLDLDIVEVTL